MNFTKTIAAISLSLICAGAIAGPVCTAEPKEKWMSEADMKGQIDKLGYKVDRFLISGTCYEIYGRNKDGKKAEVYFNPVDAKIVKERIGK